MSAEQQQPFYEEFGIATQSSVDQFMTSLSVWVHRDKMPSDLVNYASEVLQTDTRVRELVCRLGVDIDRMTIDELRFVAEVMSS